MQFSFHLFILLFGFVIGNLFPTFFGDFLGKVGTPLFLFLALDFFNYFYYSHQRRSKKIRVQQPTKLAQNTSWAAGSNFKSPRMRLGATQIGKRQNAFFSSFSSQANSFKIGFLFGLFVDAFKVGS